MTEENGWRGRMEEKILQLEESVKEHHKNHMTVFQCDLHTKEIEEMQKAMDWVKSRIWLAIGGLAVLQIVGWISMWEKMSRVFK
jgi:hypothetical protein